MLEPNEDKKDEICEATWAFITDNGRMFVHGSYEAIKHIQGKMFEFESVAKQKDERIAELETEVNKLKAENERWKNDRDILYLKLSGSRIAVSSLTARLSEALGALNYIYQNCDSEQERWAEETAKAIINNPDNARLLERDRLRDAVIQAAKFIKKNVRAHDPIAVRVISNVSDALEALEGHENQNPRQG